jgi:predicted AlkP superfamily phosphohydrolase/phosphomutase
MAAPAKLVVIGIDAGDRELIQRWAAQGKLPNIRRVMERGTWGLTDTPPGMEASIWPSFYTGVSAGQHGMLNPSETRRHGSYIAMPFEQKDFTAEPYWEPLSRAGKRVAVIDAPHAFLSRTINGIHIVDWATHDPMAPVHHQPEKAFQVWPTELGPDIVQHFGRDTIGRCDLLNLRTAEDFLNFREDLLERIRRKTGLNLFILQHGGWDCFFSVYHEAHCAGHRCWHFHDQSHPKHDPHMTGELGDIVEQVYRVIDEGIGRILDFVGPEANVILYCSHGMTTGNSASLLLDDILMHLDGQVPSVWKRTVARFIEQLWPRLPTKLKPFVHLLSATLWPFLRRNFLEPKRSARKYFEVRSSDDSTAVRLNIIGRDQHGRLEPGREAEAYSEWLMDELLALKLRGTDAPAVSRVVRADEVYDGPRRADLPDLLIDWNCQTNMYGVWSIHLGYLHNKHKFSRTGSHTAGGMFFAVGPDYPAAKLNEETSVYSFATTIARLMGVDIPKPQTAVAFVLDTSQKPEHTAAPAANDAVPELEPTHSCAEPVAQSA